VTKHGIDRLKEKNCKSNTIFKGCTITHLQNLYVRQSKGTGWRVLSSTQSTESKISTLLWVLWLLGSCAGNILYKETVQIVGGIVLENSAEDRLSKVIVLVLVPGEPLETSVKLG
ncbi:hypothetical protein F5051DRAFT_431686, partial [Lentinula edodes]